MNRENAAQFLPLVQALADGKTLQFRFGASDWTDLGESNNIMFGEDIGRYRIKPESVVVETWHAIYSNGGVGYSYASKHAAISAAARSVISILHLTITNGVVHAEVTKL